MREFNDYEKEVYNIVEVADEPTTDEIPAPTIEEVVPVVEPEPAPEPVAEVIPEVAPLPVPEYKSKKFIQVDDEEALYTQLASKYGHKSLKPEDKAYAYLKAQNPELDDNEIAFIAASDYGIGVDGVEDEDLTDEQRMAIRKQDIARKKLFTQADGYFSDQASQVALPDYDPLDVDPEYKEYRTQKEADRVAKDEQAATLQTVLNNIEKTAKKITEVNEDFEIEIDERKLPVNVKFKLNEEKQKQLVDYAKRHNPSDGQFDWNGYMLSLAPSAFAKDLIKAATKQALTTDRENFIEKELKNSTLRNNDVSQTFDKPFDIVEAWPFGR